MVVFSGTNCTNVEQKMAWRCWMVRNENGPASWVCRCRGWYGKANALGIDRLSVTASKALLVSRAVIPILVLFWMAAGCE
eukprot:COSAG02_NODE_28_length_51367_cov_70.053932_20_plen_80_part_00